MEQRWSLEDDGWVFLEAEGREPVKVNAYELAAAVHDLARSMEDVPMMSKGFLSKLRELAESFGFPPELSTGAIRAYVSKICRHVTDLEKKNLAQGNESENSPDSTDTTPEA